MGTNSTEKYDNCMVCNNQTTMPINRHVDYRIGYVEGEGQIYKLCN